MAAASLEYEAIRSLEDANLVRLNKMVSQAVAGEKSRIVARDAPRHVCFRDNRDSFVVKSGTMQPIFMDEYEEPPNMSNSPVRNYSWEEEIPLKIFVGSWNMNNSKFNPDTLPFWLKRNIGCDILAVTLQEVPYFQREPLGKLAKCKVNVASPMLHQMQIYYGPEFTPLMSLAVGDNEVIIMIRANLKPFVGCLETSFSDTTDASRLGLMVKFTVYHTSFCFLACRLFQPSGQQKTAQRNHNLADIIKDCSLDNVDLSSAYHHLFVFGDLQYEICIPPLFKNDDEKARREYMAELIEHCDHVRLHNYDELHQQIQNQNVLSGFQLPIPNYPPPYKVVPGELLTYDMTQAPCFSDRVVWKSLPNFDDLAIAEIGIAQEVITSDYKPMYSVFEVSVYESAGKLLPGKSHRASIVPRFLRPVGLVRLVLESVVANDLVCQGLTENIRPTLRIYCPMLKIDVFAKDSVGSAFSPSWPVPTLLNFNCQMREYLSGEHLILAVYDTKKLSKKATLIGQTVVSLDPLCQAGNDLLQSTQTLMRYTVPCGSITFTLRVHNNDEPLPVSTPRTPRIPSDADMLAATPHDDVIPSANLFEGKLSHNHSLAVLRRKQLGVMPAIVKALPPVRPVVRTMGPSDGSDSEAGETADDSTSSIPSIAINNNSKGSGNPIIQSFPPDESDAELEGDRTITLFPGLTATHTMALEKQSVRMSRATSGEEHGLMPGLTMTNTLALEKQSVRMSRATSGEEHGLTPGLTMTQTMALEKQPSSYDEDNDDDNNNGKRHYDDDDNEPEIVSLFRQYTLNIPAMVRCNTGEQMVVEDEDDSDEQGDFFIQRLLGVNTTTNNNTVPKPAAVPVPIPSKPTGPSAAPAPGTTATKKNPDRSLAPLPSQTLLASPQKPSSPTPSSPSTASSSDYSASPAPSPALTASTMDSNRQPQRPLRNPLVKQPSRQSNAGVNPSPVGMRAPLAATSPAQRPGVARSGSMSQARPVTKSASRMSLQERQASMKAASVSRGSTGTAPPTRTPSAQQVRPTRPVAAQCRRLADK